MNLHFVIDVCTVLASSNIVCILLVYFVSIWCVAYPSFNFVLYSFALQFPLQLILDFSDGG